MSKSKIPMRPSGKYKISASDQDALSWYFLSGESQTEVYRKFIRPDLQTSKAALDKLAKAFFAEKEVRKYLSDYEETINALFEPKEKPKMVENKELTEDDKQSAIRAVAHQVIDLARRAGAEDVDIELVIKLMDKLQWLDDKDAAVEPPRRYLAVSCMSECRYRAFVEQECEDLCVYCKYKAYANENGVHYRSEQQLNINPNKD